MHTKVLLLFYFRSHDEAADSPIWTLFLPTILTVPLRTFAAISVPFVVRYGVQVAWGSWKLFELAVLRLQSKCALLKEVRVPGSL